MDRIIVNSEMLINILYMSKYYKKGDNTMTEKFEYWQSEKNDEWYFHLVAPNGEIIAQSEGYKSKDGCIKGAEAVKKYSQTAEILEKEVKDE